MNGPTPRWRRVLARVLVGLLLVGVLPAAMTGYALYELRSTLLRSVPAPEAATGLRAVDAKPFARTAVVAAHPEAAQAGYAVLADGGTAIDAAVAVQAALTLVEPQSSGIGGGAFLLYWHAPTRTLTAFDGREVAPAAATPKLFLDEAGEPLSFPAALVGGRSVGVPGVLRMLERAHARFGRTAWSRLFDGPIALARRGFLVTPRLSTLIGLDPALPALPAARAYFYGADGWALAPRELLANEALADTLEQVATAGASAFYTGAIADDIVATVRSARRPSLARVLFDVVARQWGVATEGEPTVENPGGLTAADLARYEPLEREPLCIPYRSWRICGAPPPSGGVAVLQVMRLLERFDLAKLPEGSPEELHLLLSAEALVEADRDRWVADPAFARVPVEGLLDPEYLDERASKISADRALGPVSAGSPPGALAAAVPGRAHELASTSHFVVVDPEGSIACMTTSIEFGFGSHLLVRGFLLNNQLTDFAFTPEQEGHPVLNAVAPGKRPRSAMSPIIVFDAESGAPVLAVGSPGGPRIIGYVARVLVAVLDHGLDPSVAIARPHVLYARGQAEVEDIGWTSRAERDALGKALEEKGHAVSVTQENSGVHAVSFRDGKLVPGIDPRRDGAAAGH